MRSRFHVLTCNNVRRRWQMDILLSRYKACWLPLLAKHCECGVTDGSLYVPLDCEWIWHCHRLNPVVIYSEDYILFYNCFFQCVLVENTLFCFTFRFNTKRTVRKLLGGSWITIMLNPLCKEIPNLKWQKNGLGCILRNLLSLTVAVLPQRKFLISTPELLQVFHTTWFLLSKGSLLSATRLLNHYCLFSVLTVFEVLV